MVHVPALQWLRLVCHRDQALGLCFFLLFIKDIYQKIPIQIRLYADYYASFKEMKSSYDRLDIDSAIARIHSCCVGWQMTLNTEKNGVYDNFEEKTVFQIHVFVSWAYVEFFGFLEVVLASNVRCNAHVDGVVKKSIQTLSSLRRYLGSSPPDIKPLAYETYILFAMDYAAIVLERYTPVNEEKQESILRKAAPFIFSKYSSFTSVTELLPSWKAS